MGKVWFVTGAGRGLGVDIVKQALEAGHRVVATGRRSEAIVNAIGHHEQLLPIALDITDPQAAAQAAQAALARFGSIDVLVNNAGNFYAGFFEEVSDVQLRAQMETNFFGPLNVTRAILPTMREQRCGQIITVTSTAALVGGAFMSAYAASKFALEGWVDSLRPELAPFGVELMSVVPGFFRTELLVAGASTFWPERAISDYSERSAQTIEALKRMDGSQPGDPSKLAHALVLLSDSGKLPQRFVAGSDAMAAVEANLQLIRDQIDAHRALSDALAMGVPAQPR